VRHKATCPEGQRPLLPESPFEPPFKRRNTCVTRQLTTASSPPSSSNSKPAYHQTNCSQPLVRQLAGTRVPWCSWMITLVPTATSPHHGASPWCTKLHSVVHHKTRVYRGSPWFIAVVKWVFPV